MKIRFFKHVRCAGDWELNLIGKVWNLRIARCQFALWRNYEPLFDFRFGKRLKQRAEDNWA